MGGVLFSISISVVLACSSCKAHRLKSRLRSIWTWVLVPSSFVLGLGRMVEVARGRALATYPPWAHGGRVVGDTGDVTSTGDRATCEKIESSPEKNLVLSTL